MLTALVGIGLFVTAVVGLIACCTLNRMSKARANAKRLVRCESWMGARELLAKGHEKYVGLSELRAKAWPQAC